MRPRGWTQWRPDEIVWNGEVLWGRIYYRSGGEARVYVRNGQRMAVGDLIVNRGTPYVVTSLGGSKNSEPFIEVVAARALASRA